MRKRERVEEYQKAGEKMKIVIDYFARYAVVPRKGDDPDIPESWSGKSTEEIQAGVQREFGEEIGPSIATYTWQRLGADHDTQAALSMLQNRREAFLDAGLSELATWR